MVLLPSTRSQLRKCVGCAEAISVSISRSSSSNSTGSGSGHGDVACSAIHILTYKPVSQTLQYPLLKHSTKVVEEVTERPIQELSFPSLKEVAYVLLELYLKLRPTDGKQALDKLLKNYILN